MGEKVVIASPLKLARPRPVAFLSGPFPRAREATALFRPCHANRRVTPSPNLAHSSMGQTARLSVTATTKRWPPIALSRDGSGRKLFGGHGQGACTSR